MIKYLDGNNSEQRVLALSYPFGRQSTTVGKSRQELTGAVISACNNRERITSSLVLSLTPYTVQELLPRECVTYGGLDFPSQLIKTILSGPSTDQPNVDNLSVTPSFQVILGCIELAIKANSHILCNDCYQKPTDFMV